MAADNDDDHVSFGRNMRFLFLYVEESSTAAAAAAAANGIHEPLSRDLSEGGGQ